MKSLTPQITQQKLIKIWETHITGWGNKNYLLPISHLICKRLSEYPVNAKILDLGCGLGNKSLIFSKMGFAVSGIDGLEDRIQICKTVCPEAHFFKHDINTSLPFEDEAFDVVFSSSVFQYIDHEKAFRECHRILKKGGSLIMVENLNGNPITRCLRFFLKLFRYSYEFRPRKHLTYDEVCRLEGSFIDCEKAPYYILSPLSFLKILRFSFPFFSKTDALLLKSGHLNKYSWLIYFSGKKHENKPRLPDQENNNLQHLTLYP